MHDEAAGEAQIKALPRDGRHHLSHIIRNGLCNILATSKLGGDVEKALMEMEAKIKEVGL